MQDVSSPPTPENTDAQKRKHARRFTDWDREDQIAAFFPWLPKELHNAPGIDWTRFPSRTMGYCIHAIGNTPDAGVLAVAIASAQSGLATHSQIQLLKALSHLFRDLRSTYHMEQISDLRDERIWYAWLANSEKREATRQQVKAYGAVAHGHIPRYFLRLTLPDRLRMQQYAFPPLPPDLRRDHVHLRGIKVAQQARRKAQSDILVPLYPVLRQMIRFRKELAERTIQAIREARRKAEAGEVELPFRFSHTDEIPEVNRDARTVSEVRIIGRPVTMHFILWDKFTWVDHHHDRYSDKIVDTAKARRAAYVPEKNCYFVQFEGNASDLLWCGDLIKHRLFQRFSKVDYALPGYRERWQLARQLGFSNGCQCDRPGLLSPTDRWFTEVGHRDGDCVFEPESLHRGVIFGATLAMIALSNGSRVSELLQVSWNKERRVTRTETVVMLGADGQPCLGADGKPLTRQVKIHLQYLLPKGAKSEEERQLFPLSKECLRLMGEIKTMLEEAHGEIPVVSPSRSNAKYEDLQPERYLFQWAAAPDGKHACITINDVQMLLRFIFYGLDLYTAQGEPIRVTAHILRHVMATHARHYRNVPPEVVAHFFLHHRLRAVTGRDLSPSEVSDYYFMMTEEQRFAIIRTDLDEQEELDRTLLRTAPSPRDLEQKNADLQAVYDEWHTLHPTALGHCGCPGLCPRGNDRALCLGCFYHVEDPEKLGAALAWRASYAKQAELFEAQGNVIDARQARIKVQLLDDMINVMRMQRRQEATGNYIPLSKVLPSPHRKAEEIDEAEN